MLLKFPGGEASLSSSSVLCFPRCRMQSEVFLGMMKFSGSAGMAPAALFGRVTENSSCHKLNVKVLKNSVKTLENAAEVSPDTP